LAQLNLCIGRGGSVASPSLPSHAPTRVLRPRPAVPTNQIVYCERCDVAVHQACYGIAAVPEGDWLCDPCREHEEALRAQGRSEVCVGVGG
jgi:hypothetical protein